MNANMFDIAERGYEAAVEMQHQRRLAAEEDYTEAVAEIENDLSADAAVVADIVADVIFEDDFATKVADLYAAGKTIAAGMYLCERNGADTDYVCGQDFGYGSQGACHKANTARARAVRRLPV